MMFGRNIYGVDFGSDTVKIYSAKKDSITAEKNVIAVRLPGDVIAVGNKAYEMIGKNPPAVDVRSPVRAGMIADADRAGFVLKKMLIRAEQRNGVASELFFAAPLGLTEIERRAYLMTGNDAGTPSRHIYLVDQPILDAFAVGIPVETTRGSMIVNIGASVTTISVIAQGQVILSDRFACGGLLIDEAIADLVRRRTNVRIDTRTASRLKIALADLTVREDARKTIGIDTLSGMPGEVVVTSKIVTEGVSQILRPAAQRIEQYLMRVPPQIAGFIRAEGVFLSGGCAAIPGIVPYFEEICGGKIMLPEGFAHSTISGLREMIIKKQIRKYAYFIKDER